jgi:prephenate dehydratase
MSVQDDQLSVAYPGRDGAHSATACERLFPRGAELLAVPTFTAVVEATADATVEFGILPIESSLTGAIAETHDLLYESRLSITGETILPIRHCLVGVADALRERIRIVRSHPAALDQCRKLLAAMPWATPIASATTADAAHEVAERGDPGQAAIASEIAARMYGLTVIASDVGDHPEVYTRFVSIARFTRLDRASENWRTSFSFVTDHKPGALHRAIEPFGRHGLDLVQLVSRPIPGAPWRYRFDAVLAGHPLDPVVRQAFAEVVALTRRLRVSGSYPAASSP